MEIKIVENVLKLNDEIAQLNRETLQNAGVKCINIIGSPGSGKTRLLERTLERLKNEMNIAVLTGDLATTRDAKRLSIHCENIAQINTGKSCHLDANQIRQGLSSFNLDELDLLIIENVGNLICPVGFDLGQDAKIGMFSVPEGDDKPAKHPYIVLEAQLLILNKIDLMPYVQFDSQVFYNDLHSICEGVPLIELSAETGAGLDLWLRWLRELVSSSPVLGKKDISASTVEAADNTR